MSKITVHEVKCWPVFFKEVDEGRKTFEVRKNDRDYKAGDILILREWDPQEFSYTGKEAEFEITYILDDVQFVPWGMVIMAIKRTVVFRQTEEDVKNRWEYMKAAEDMEANAELGKALKWSAKTWNDGGEFEDIVESVKWIEMPLGGGLGKINIDKLLEAYRRTVG